MRKYNTCHVAWLGKDSTIAQTLNAIAQIYQDDDPPDELFDLAFTPYGMSGEAMARVFFEEDYILLVEHEDEDGRDMITVLYGPEEYALGILNKILSPLSVLVLTGIDTK